MKLNPYLFFQGQCKAAIEFYVQVLGAKVLMMMDHSQAPPEHVAPGVSKDWIMHARIEFKGQILMASDGPSEPMTGSSLSLMVDTPEEAEQLFAALSEGGSSPDAHGPDLLGGALRHADRQVRNPLDDQLRTGWLGVATGTFQRKPRSTTRPILFNTASMKSLLKLAKRANFLLLEPPERNGKNSKT